MYGEAWSYKRPYTDQRNHLDFLFFIGFQLFYNAVGVFRVVFNNPCFNAGSDKSKHERFHRINLLADWRSHINKTVKYGLQLLPGESLVNRFC